MPRSLTIYMPYGRTEYWFTERVFEIGDKLERNGETWTVVSVGETNGNGKHPSVTVRLNGESEEPTEA